MKLYRPVGKKELDLIMESGYKAFPPRLQEQPIFYPVLNVQYARQIAAEWNTLDAASGYKGYVLSFEVNDEFVKRYPVQCVGANMHQELWIPAEELDEFNKNIVGKIELIEAYYQKINAIEPNGVFFASNGKTIEIAVGDITKENTDAIVNAANTSLLGGGGVDGAIHRAAGSGLLDECRLLHGCKTGQAKITKAYNLKTKYIIHTPGPNWNDGKSNEEILLADSYKNSLMLAEEYKCESMSFPSISTGIFRFPLDKASKIAVNTIFEILQNCNTLFSVRMVCFDDNTFKAYVAALEALKKLAPAVDGNQGERLT